MNRFPLVLLLTGMSILTSAQTSAPKNSIFFEVGGNGLFASLNYERQLTKQPGLGVRAGFGIYSEEAYYLTIPVSLYYLFPLSKNGAFLEAGAGVTWVRQDAKLFQKPLPTDDNFTCFVPSFGYRKQTKKNLVWRVMATPVVDSYSVTPWFGFGLGKLF